MRMKERPPKPVKIARKININSKRNKEYISFLKDFENNPSDYFNSKFHNKPFIIGRSYSQSPFAKESAISFTNIRSIKSGFRKKRTAKVAKSYSGGQTKTYITDNELDLIYENADIRRNVTETEEKDISNKTLSQFLYYLKQQENSLKKYESLTKKRTRLSLSMSKKLNCKPNALVMNKQELYRPRKEVLDSISYDGSNMKTKYEHSLRQNTTPQMHLGMNYNNTTNNSTTLIGNMIQETMKENTKGKIDLCLPKEVIRNPSYDLLNNNNATLSNNIHLRNKFSSNESFFSAVSKPSINLHNMSIKGVNLLLFEKSIARKLKGQKILYLEKRKSNPLSVSTQTIRDKMTQFPFIKLKLNDD